MSERKFKVGDRVVGTGVYSGINIKGLVGTVITMNSASYGIEFDEEKSEFHSCLGKGKVYHCWNVAEDKIELYDKIVIVIYRKDNHVIAHNKATGKKGIAKCNPEDTFDFNIGAKLAFERLICEVKEVKRHAKVGEYIKITKGYMSGGTYENGDVIKVTKFYDGNIKKPKGINLRTNEETVSIFSDEYVVLEGYKPTEEPKKEEPKKPYNGKVVCVNNNSTDRLYTVGKIYEFKDGNFTDDRGFKRPSMGKSYSFEDWLANSNAKFIEVIE
jgi:hypothetical protein